MLSIKNHRHNHNHYHNYKTPHKLYNIKNNYYYNKIYIPKKESFINIELKENYEDNINIFKEKFEPCMHSYIEDIKGCFSEELVYKLKNEKKNNLYNDNNSEDDIKCICLLCTKYIISILKLKKHYISHKHNLFIDFKDWSLICLSCNCKYALELLNTQNKFRILFQFLREKKFRTPKKLLGLSVEEINFIKYKNFTENFKKCSKILFMVGAGISTAAGIPDFRSENGLFKQLQKKYKLSSQEEFFHKKTFLKNPEYFYNFLKSFNLEKYQPTISHMFMNFLVKKNLVKYIFTQNIDGLEKKAKISNEKIIYAHGNLFKGHCAECNISIDINLINDGIKKNKIIYCPECKGPCKPKIVFYGEQLPSIFFDKMDEIKNNKDIDLIIIMGTSLNVLPFTNIPKLVDSNVCKVLFNFEKVGNYFYDKLTENSLFIQGNIDKNLIIFLKDVNLYHEFELFVRKEYDENLDDIISNNKNKKNGISDINFDMDNFLEIPYDSLDELMENIDRDFYMQKFKK